jgi:hypothetical protein
MDFWGFYPWYHVPAWEKEPIYKIVLQSKQPFYSPHPILEFLTLECRVDQGYYRQGRAKCPHT